MVGVGAGELVALSPLPLTRVCLVKYLSALSHEYLPV